LERSVSTKTLASQPVEDCKLGLSAGFEESTNSLIEHYLWLNLSTCATFIERELERRFHTEFNFTPPRFGVLAQLENEPNGVVLGELARRLRVTPASITLIVRRLVEDGYVTRRNSGFDRRIHIVFVTDAGKKAFRRMATRYSVWLDTLFKRSCPAQLAECAEQLHRLKTDLQNAARDSG
jgi:DNA-binding MarR family transcriptional regulator